MENNGSIDLIMIYFIAIYISQDSRSTVVFVYIPEHVSEQLMYIFFWGTASAISLAVMYKFGGEFVDRPKLVQTKLKAE